MSERRATRTERARARARRAKAAVAVAGVAAFLAALPLAKSTYAGHPKRRPRALGAPKSFRRSVHRDLLSAGVLAPAETPPEAVTSTS